MQDLKDKAGSPAGTNEKLKLRKENMSVGKKKRWRDKMLTEAQEPHYQNKASGAGMLMSCKVGLGRETRCWH
jgi:hypothetical protein